jgi:hypothetical protein
MSLGINLQVSLAVHVLSSRRRRRGGVNSIADSLNCMEYCDDLGNNWAENSLTNIRTSAGFCLGVCKCSPETKRGSDSSILTVLTASKCGSF